MNYSDFIDWKRTNGVYGCIVCKDPVETTQTISGGNPEQWSRYPALQNVNISNYNINNVGSPIW